ncbi:MAG: beta-propeller domain-containing protein [Lachnospiraceae bacterium]|nr:beta-propeller domain-containing protein [Lachnospiraceae bacterium]
MENMTEKELEEFIKQQAEEIPVLDSLSSKYTVKRMKGKNEKMYKKREKMINRKTKEGVNEKMDKNTNEKIKEKSGEGGSRTSNGKLGKFRKWMYRISASAAVFLCGGMIAYGGIYGYGTWQENQSKKGLTQRQFLCMEELEQANQIKVGLEGQKEWYQWAKEYGINPQALCRDGGWIVEEAEYSTNGMAAMDGVSAVDSVGSESTAIETESKTDYSETNVQVEGIDEADIVKTDGEYLYILDAHKIYIVDTTNGMKVIGNITIEDNDKNDTKTSEEEDNDKNDNQGTGKEDNDEDGNNEDNDTDDDNAYFVEMYLKDQQLILIEKAGWYHYYDCSYTDAYDEGKSKASAKVSIYNIEDKENPVLEKKLEQSGNYMSSRVKDDYLYLFTEYTTFCPDDISDYDAYVPKVGGEELSYSDVCIFPEGESSESLIVSVVDLKEKEITDKMMLTSGSGLFYVSENHIYSVVLAYKDNSRFSEIVKIAYHEDELEYIGKTEVEGYIKGQYFMDEKDGFLRAVAYVYPTYDCDAENEPGTGDVVEKSGDASRLYVLDENLKEVSRIDNIAPEESLHSCRFMGDMVYFVTFRQVDPLFAADLSDPYHPVLTGQLKIPGFSQYLHPYGDGLLLGIGYDADEETGKRKGVKLTMFDVGDPTDIKELTSMYLPECSTFTSEPKAILVNVNKNLIGISTNRYDRTRYYYCLSYVDGEFVVNTEEEISNMLTRGVYIDNILYVANRMEVKAVSLEDYSLVDWLQLVEN